MRIAVGCDHVGFPLKASLVEALEEDEHAVLDLGAHGTDPVDYPALARAVATAIGNGFVELGVLMCESAIGGSIAANKFMGIRAAACHDAETARHSREHENVNLLCVDATQIAAEAAVALVREWLSVEFSATDHDVREIALISEVEAAARHDARHDHAGARGARAAPRPVAPRSAPPAAPTPPRAAAPAPAAPVSAAEIRLEMQAPKAAEVSLVETFIASVKDDNVRAMATRIFECVRERFPSAAGVPSSDGFSFSVNGEHAASVSIGKGFVQLEAGPDRIPTSRIRDVEGLEAALSLPSIVRALDAVKS